MNIEIHIHIKFALNLLEAARLTILQQTQFEYAESPGLGFISNLFPHDLHHEQA